MPGAGLLLALMTTLPAAAPPPALAIPVRTKTLGNGLRVVVAESREAPVFGLCLLYGVGSRLEPRGRTGFAHLFEHLMFEGTPAAPKGVFDRVCEGSGGNNNGQTRPDHTIYTESAPASSLERFLWLEADRMKALTFSKETLDNQRDVVKEEIRVNIQNDPYGYFEFYELPKILFGKWENAHDGYGNFADLDAASLDDVRSFFSTYYRPNNAVLAIAGDVDANAVFAAAEKHFGSIPAGEIPKAPDLAEPKLPKPAITILEAPLANTPALAAGWRTPPREHRDALPLVLLAEVLHGGRASRLYRGLVEGREIATDVSGGINLSQGGDLYRGSTAFQTRIAYKRGVAHTAVLKALEEEIARIAREGVPEAELVRARTKLVSTYVSSLESRGELAIELAQAVAFDGDARSVLERPSRLAAVTSADVKRAAATWLDASARAVVVKAPPAEKAGRDGRAKAAARKAP